MSDPPASNKKKLPTIYELLITTPLYTSFDVEDSDGKYLVDLRRGDFQFDCYCVGCRKSAPFKGIKGNFTSVLESDALRAGYFPVYAKCQRHGHEYLFWFDFGLRIVAGPKTEKFLVKVGQTPSIEDIVGSDLLPFKGLLSDSDFAELKRATGLASHGIGIGSFVYLRRIFERLIEKHYKEALAQGINLDGYERMRMSEKITALKTVLPSGVVKHAAAYGILSKGLHELDENTCRAYFPAVRGAIMRILEQDLEADRKAQSDKELDEQMKKIQSDLNRGKKD